MNGLEDLLGSSYGNLISTSVLSGVKLPSIETIGDQSYLSVISLGLSFVFDDNMEICAIQIHSGGHEGFCRYQDTLPMGLAFDMGQAEIRDVLGKPETSGEEQTVLILGNKPAWDSFLTPHFRLHIEYNFERTALRLVSLIANTEVRTRIN